MTSFLMSVIVLPEIFFSSSCTIADVTTKVRAERGGVEGVEGSDSAMLRSRFPVTGALPTMIGSSGRAAYDAVAAEDAPKRPSPHSATFSAPPGVTAAVAAAAPAIAAAPAVAAAPPVTAAPAVAAAPTVSVAPVVTAAALETTAAAVAAAAAAAAAVAAAATPPPRFGAAFDPPTPSCDTAAKVAVPRPDAG